MELEPEADVLIIGGGIAGAGLAAYLSPHAKVVLLEKESRAGYHSTSRSAAVFLRNYGNAVIRALSDESFPLFDHIQQEANCNPFLSPRGLLQVAGADEGDAFQAALKAGKDLVILTPAEAYAMVPILRQDKIISALYELAATDIDVELLHQSYLKKLRKQDGKLVLNAEVLAASLDENKLWHVKTMDGEFRAKVMVNAAGAWADVFAELAQVRPLTIQPKRRSMAVLPAPDLPQALQAGFDHWPLFGTVSEKWYAKPQSGKLLVSPAEEDDCPPHDAYSDDMVLAEGLDRFQSMVTMEVTRLENSWAGLRSFAPDRSPVMGFDPQASGFFWLAGQGGYGVQTSPALSKRAAIQIQQFLAKKNIETDELSQKLSPKRFH